MYLFNPCHVTGLFLYTLKTSENQRFSDVFRGYRKRPVAWNRLMRRSTYFSLISILFEVEGIDKFVLVICGGNGEIIEMKWKLSNYFVISVEYYLPKTMHYLKLKILCLKLDWFSLQYSFSFISVFIIRKVTALAISSFCEYTWISQVGLRRHYCFFFLRAQEDVPPGVLSLLSVRIKWTCLDFKMTLVLQRSSIEKSNSKMFWNV